jgi:tetratricopeptide (TPR) repeat protein
MADFDKAAQLKPGLKDSYCGCGGNDEGHVILFWDAVLRRQPDDVAAYLGRGLAHTNKGEYDRALADYGQAIRLKPDMADAYVRRARAYDEKGDHDRAIADLDQAIRLKPDDADAYMTRGKAYAAKGDFARGIVDFNLAMRIAPENIDTYMGRAEIYSRMGDHDRAIFDYNHLIIALGMRGYLNARLARGDEYVEIGALDLAIADYDDSEGTGGFSGKCWAKGVRGVDLKAALDDCNKGLEEVADVSVARGRRAFVHYRMAQYDHAIEDATAALKVDPKLALALYVRGLARIARSDQAGGAADIAAARAVEPRFAERFAGYGVKPPA